MTFEESHLFPFRLLGIHQLRMILDVSPGTVVLAIGIQTWNGT